MPNETRAVAVIDEVRHTLDKMLPQFRLALPAHVTPEKFVRTVMTALQQKPEILQCDRRSVYAACMLAAQDGLMIDGREAALVPRGGKAAYSRMVAGICKMIRNSGEIKEIDAIVVYSNDEYAAWTDENGPHFRHVKARGGERGSPITTYAYAIGADGAHYFEEIDEAAMKSIREMGAKNGPWAGPFDDEMRRKSAIRRMGKYRLPLSTDLIGAITDLESDVALAPAATEPIPGDDPPPEKQATRTREKILGKEAAAGSHAAAQRQPTTVDAERQPEPPPPTPRPQDLSDDIPI